MQSHCKDLIRMKRSKITTKEFNLLIEEHNSNILGNEEKQDGSTNEGICEPSIEIPPAQIELTLVTEQCLEKTALF